MSDDRPHIVLHAGVHKTATSFIQSILRRNAGRLKKHGVHYVHHRKTRKGLTLPCQMRGYALLGTPRGDYDNAEALQARVTAFLHTVAAAPGARILLSDENLSGHCGHCVRGGTLYRGKGMHIPLIAEQIDRSGVGTVREVHLALRNYADFFSAAYVEYLRSARGHAPVVSEADLKRKVLLRRPNWATLVRVWRKSVPDARLVLWQHEEFRPLTERVLTGLCGPTLIGRPLETPRNPRLRPTASARAVAEILRAIEEKGPKAGLEDRVRIQREFPRGPAYPAYDPWTEEERAELDARYAADIQEIDAAYPGALLRPSPHPSKHAAAA